jgi:predicted dienelactone hydrolase
VLCQPAWAKAEPEFRTDPPGFDRAAFQKEFNAEVLAFFQTQLTAAPRP